MRRCVDDWHDFLRFGIRCCSVITVQRVWDVYIQCPRPTDIYMYISVYTYIGFVPAAYMPCD